MNRARLWAVTAYFNPRGFRSRRINYDIFRRALNLPLLTVELASASGFELTSDQADVLVEIPHGNLMWQGATAQRRARPPARRLRGRCLA